MSSPFTGAAHAAAAYVLRSLMEHPDRQTPEEIAGAHAADDLDADSANRALGELASRGLATEETGGRWRLTDAGRGAMDQT